MCCDEVGCELRAMSMSTLGRRFLRAGGFLRWSKPRAQGFADARGLGSSLVRFRSVKL